MTWRERGWFVQAGWKSAHRLRPDVIPPTTLCGRWKRGGWSAAQDGVPLCLACLRCRLRPHAERLPTSFRFGRVDVVYQPGVLKRPIINIELPAVG